MAWFTTLIEFFGGIGMIVGACVFVLTVPLSIVMLTAMLSVHLQYGFSSVRLRAVTASGAQFGPIGIEMNLLYIVGLLTLALGGSGCLSVDAWLSARKRRADTRTQTAKAGI
jgi:putative oxidoreductase